VRRCWSLPLPALLVTSTFLGGCVSAEEFGPVTLFRYDIFVQLGLPIATVASVAIGMRLRKAGSMLLLVRSWGLIIGALLLVIPGSSYVSSAAIMLTDSGFSEYSGWWFSPEPESVRFEDVSRIELSAASSTTGKQSKGYYLCFYDGVGAYRSVPVSPLMREGGLVPVLRRAQLSGVPVLKSSPRRQRHDVQ
jgi:hypothetical protein